MDKIKKRYDSAFHANYGMYVFKTPDNIETTDNILDRAY